MISKLIPTWVWIALIVVGTGGGFTLGLRWSAAKLAEERLAWTIKEQAHLTNASTQARNLATCQAEKKVLQASVDAWIKAANASAADAEAERAKARELKKQLDAALAQINTGPMPDQCEDRVMETGRRLAALMAAVP